MICNTFYFLFFGTKGSFVINDKLFFINLCINSGNIHLFSRLRENQNPFLYSMRALPVDLNGVIIQEFSITIERHNSSSLDLHGFGEVNSKELLDLEGASSSSDRRSQATRSH